MARSVDPDQTAPICSGSTLSHSILNLSVMLGNYLQQTTSAGNIFRCIFLGALWVNLHFLQRRSFVFFVALRPKSTAMVMAGRSVQLTTFFPGQAWTSSFSP